MQGSDRPERRQAPRLPVRCQVAFRTIREGSADPKTVAAQTLNISSSGLCMVSPQALERDTHLALELSLERAPEPVVAVGRVVWCEPHEQGFRAGVCFTWLREEDRNALRVISDFLHERLGS